MPNFPLEIPPNSPFPIQNIPFGIFSTKQGRGLGVSLQRVHVEREDNQYFKIQKRAGTAVGKYALDLDQVANAGLFDGAGLTDKLKDVFTQVC